MKKLIIPIVALALLAGCSGAPKQTPTTSASPVTERTATGAGSFTADAQGWAGDNGKYVTGAVEKEPNWYLVSTNIADPRGKDGSPEAKAAIAICNAIREHRADAKYVRVDERDGTAFVIWQPGTANDECTEV